MTGTATISGCAKYRYLLTREWGDGRRVLFVMLNPSTADADQPDATITRCVGFATAIGGGSLAVVNLFALRSTDPRALLAAEDPIGPDNNDHTLEAVDRAGIVICGWGAHPFARRRGAEIIDLIRRAGQRPMCLRLTKDGHPAHPLYLPSSLRPFPLDASKEETDG